MAHSVTQDPLLEDLGLLSAEQQQQIRDLVHELATSAAAKRGLRFAIDNPLAQPAEPASSEPADETSPESFMAIIRSLLSEGRVTTARELAQRGTEKFPDHSALQSALRVLTFDGKAALTPGNWPETSREFEWLRSPPEWARGKWVALIGSEAVASAETLVDLAAHLKTMELPQKPLVHRID